MSFLIDGASTTEEGPARFRTLGLGSSEEESGHFGRVRKNPKTQRSSQVLEDGSYGIDIGNLSFFVRFRLGCDGMRGLDAELCVELRRQDELVQTLQDGHKVARGVLRVLEQRSNVFAVRRRVRGLTFQLVGEGGHEIGEAAKRVR